MNDIKMTMMKKCTTTHNLIRTTIPLIIIILILLLQLPYITYCRLADDVAYTPESSENCVNENERCFHQPVTECPSAESKCRCRQLDKCKRAAVCCNINKFQLTEGLACANISTNSGYVDALHIRNASFDILNVSQSAWRRLRYMTITDGRIHSVAGEFAKHSSITCLNLSSNGIVKFEERSLVNLINLTDLDLSHNNLSHIARFKKDSNVTLDVSDNKPLQCLGLYDALQRTYLQFRNPNTTVCLTSSSFHWFNATESVPLLQVIKFHEALKDCLKNCTCVAHGKDILPGKPLAFGVAVNCSNQQFLSLPTPLPPDTIFLNISNNNITSLELLNTDPSYQSLRDLDANSNQITSILSLEGSKFMDTFITLNLRNNKFKSLPTYVFSNIFDRNAKFRFVKLGQNKLHCDCSSAKLLKVWLLTKQKYIPDSDQIYCDNIDSRVVDLTPSKLCQTQQDWTDYIYYIITAEVLLLVGLIAKVFYDYWVFKTSGYLPWPASKMPKLPCDWLCE